MIIGKEKNDNDNMHKKIDFSFKDQIRVFVIFLYLHKSRGFKTNLKVSLFQAKAPFL